MIILKGIALMVLSGFLAGLGIIGMAISQDTGHPWLGLGFPIASSGVIIYLGHKVMK